MADGKIRCQMVHKHGLANVSRSEPIVEFAPTCRGSTVWRVLFFAAVAGLLESALDSSSFTSCLYSPVCMEGGFSEVRRGYSKV